MGRRGAARAEEQRRYSHQCLPNPPPTTWLPPFSCPPPTWNQHIQPSLPLLLSQLFPFIPPCPFSVTLQSWVSPLSALPSPIPNTAPRPLP